MSGSLYESYNARSYRPTQVAEKFVWSPHFKEVQENFNTLVLGPRGSGKTTLLKMLTLPALNAWSDPRRDKVVDEIDYVSIYVPSDFTWNASFRTISLEDSVVERFTTELFNAYVKLAICDTLETLRNVDKFTPHIAQKFSVSGQRGDLDLFAENLSQDWKAYSRFSGLFGLRHGIETQISTLQRQIALSSTKDGGSQDPFSDLPFVGFIIFDQLRAFNSLFYHFFSQNYRWALCVDELEIAPTVIKKLVLGSFRSFSDQSFRIKVSASPNDDALASLSSPKAPGRNQDFRVVRLFDQSRQQLSEFSRNVFSRMCTERYKRDVSPERLLGPSVFSGDDEASTPPPRLSVDGLYTKYFRELSKKDRTFAEYLVERGFDLDDLDSGSEVRKARIRKLITTVIWRNHYFFEPEGKMGAREPNGRRRRTFRSVQELFLGEDHLFRACEGNPRVLITVLDQLLSDHEDPSVQIPFAKQGAAIRSAIASQMFLLSTLGDDEISPSGLSLVELVEAVGEYFRSSILGPKFTPDPILSFSIGASVTKRLENLVGLAINQGAIVARPIKDRQIGNFLESEVRLSYLIGIQYDLPPIKGRSVSLETILQRSKKRKAGEEQLLMHRFFEGGVDD
jgi:energy-coupling factor transporter ATP-binding protein EcfA2